nr:olfactory receptor 14C36-like [Loxodonta africana]
MPNSAMVMDCPLMEFSDVWEIRVLHAVCFSMMHFLTLIENFLIFVVTTLDKSLHIAMNFFLRNLSILDACYISVMVPNSCVNSLLDRSAISKAKCVAQIFLVVFFLYVKLLFLTFMAHERNVAICQPLHYSVIMNPQVCVHMKLASNLSGLLYSGFHTVNTFRLPFCYSSVTHQFFVTSHPC